MGRRAERPESISIMLSRREFIAGSTAASASLVSNSRLGVQYQETRRSTKPFFVSILISSGWAGDLALFRDICRNLETYSHNAIVICGADQRYTETLIDWRTQINNRFKLRRLLIHRPLTLACINDTLRQIHRDSEEFAVDGWEFSIDVDGQDRRGHNLKLALELASRTHLRAVCVLPPSSGVWDTMHFSRLSSLAKDFGELRFLIVWTQSNCANLSGIGAANQFVMAFPNAYICEEISLRASLSRLASGYSRSFSDRVLWGQSYASRGAMPPLIDRATFATVNQESFKKTASMHAAHIYSLQPHHYLDCCDLTFV